MAKPATKESARLEKDKLSKAYHASKAQALARIREENPAAAAFADWLATNPNRDKRFEAITLIGSILVPIDGLEDGLPGEPESTHQSIIRLGYTEAKPRPQPAEPEFKATMPQISITLNGPEDVANLPAIFAEFAKLAGAGAVYAMPSAATVAAVAALAVEPAPSAEDLAALKATADEIRARKVEEDAAPADDKPKRTRRTKAQIEADEAAARAAEAPAAPAPAVEFDAVQDAVYGADEPAPAVEPEAPAAPAAGYVPTYDELLEAMREFARTTPNGPLRAKEILSKYNAQNMATIKPEHYAAVYAEVRK